LQRSMTFHVPGEGQQSYRKKRNLRAATFASSAKDVRALVKGTPAGPGLLQRRSLQRSFRCSAPSDADGDSVISAVSSVASLRSVSSSDELFGASHESSVSPPLKRGQSWAPGRRSTAAKGGGGGHGPTAGRQLRTSASVATGLGRGRAVPAPRMSIVALAGFLRAAEIPPHFLSNQELGDCYAAASVLSETPLQALPSPTDSDAGSAPALGAPPGGEQLTLTFQGFVAVLLLIAHTCRLLPEFQFLSSSDKEGDIVGPLQALLSIIESSGV
jgi:hypothetical protein